MNLIKNIFIRTVSVMYSAILTHSILLSQTTKIVDGGQIKCYDTAKEIVPPSPGQPFYGQDAQFPGHPHSYMLSGDGKTVFDINTGLSWMRGPNITNFPPVKTDKMTIVQAQAWVATVNTANYGGFGDWRIPTIKELFSLYDCRGTDPSGYTGTDLSVLTPFIDANTFNFGWGQTNLGERLIDSQYGTTSKFVLDPSESGSTKLFGVNFSDGRIKGYDLIDALSHTDKKFFWQLVRGGTSYGVNSFVDNGDQSVTDQTTGLMWSKTDNGSGLSWQEALGWVQTKNSDSYLGYNDWRMPDIKELHSIVNYLNAPDYNGLPAIDTKYLFCSSITNENGQPDYPYYWSSSTHAGYGISGTAGTEADYVAFGRALGWPTTNPKWVDVHGAGAQRSDPKTGPPFLHQVVHTVIVAGVTYTGYSWGPQGDAIRGSNYVRLVRNVSGTTGINNNPILPSQIRLYQNYPNPFHRETLIKYEISMACVVQLKVYDVFGRELISLVNQYQQPGTYTVSLHSENNSMPNGVYFIKATVNNESTIRLMEVIK